jgi:isopentenyl diphosphate isomerase/L-lactate dehydrogenase-like FMN-dependent dehydrogenase
MTPPVGPGRGRQTKVFVEGVGGKRPTVPVDPGRLAERAREVMTPAAWAYVAGGAGSESTDRANRDAFDRWRIVPRMLRDVAVRDLSIELFGDRLPAPIVLSPIGVLEMAHRRADRAVARAAAEAGVPMVFSNQASVAMEDCAAVMGDSPRWFQLYWSTSDTLVASFLERAERCGCRALVLTLDTTMLGWRPRDLDLASLPFMQGQGLAQYVTDPVFRASLDEPLDAPASAARPGVGPLAIVTALRQLARYPGTWREKLSGKPRRAVQRFLATYSRPSLKWSDLARLRERTRLPILLKGLLHPEDARLAVDQGMNGVVVSNHGGRQVDGAIGALEALPGIVDAVAGAVPVLFDSGVRGGADVFKALALGATAVCLGRPYVYGLALAGERGVREVIENVVAELDLTLGLSGLASVAEIGREALVERE